MIHYDAWVTLTKALNPLDIKIFLVLDEKKAMSKTELYEECSTHNNMVVSDRLTFWREQGMITGGRSRGEPLTLTIKGRGWTDWLLEGGAIMR